MSRKAISLAMLLCVLIFSLHCSIPASSIANSASQSPLNLSWGHSPNKYTTCIGVCPLALNSGQQEGEALTEEPGGEDSSIVGQEETDPLEEEQPEEPTITGGEEDELLVDDEAGNDLLPLLLGQEDYASDRFIIKYKDNTREKGRLRYHDKLADKLSEVKKITGRKGQKYELVLLDRKVKAAEFIAGLDIEEKFAGIQYIQPDYQLSLLSDDPYFESQWGLQNNRPEPVQGRDIPIFERLHRLPPHLRDVLESHPELMELVMDTPPEELMDMLIMGDMPEDIPPHIFFELAHDPLYREMGDNVPAQQAYACDAGVVGAWEVSLGEGVIVAVIDTSIDIYHEDLTENIWVNAGEIPDDGIDDDGNGYVDDVFGWNFCANNNLVSSGMSVCDEVYSDKSVCHEVYGSGNTGDDKHGTHIAGIIAAVKDNGKGIAGAAPEAKIMPLKVFENGKAYTSDIIAAIEYAESMGAKVVNCSWGSTADNPAMKEAMENSNMLFVCAAGNSGADIDDRPVYPAYFAIENVISVAAVNRNGWLSGFSNYGESSVHVTAPGEDIFSTVPGNSYESMSGTSMAAAFVSGEAALLLAMDSSLSSAAVRERIVNYSDRLSSLTGKVLSGNKVNCANTVYEIYNEELIMVDGGAGGETVMPSDWDDFTLFDAPSTGLLNVVQLAGGNNHSLALKEDGTVWSWGRNEYGQLGDGTTTDRTTPVQVSGLTGVKAIVTGYGHSLALKEDGTVWAWGNNDWGQLGDWTTTSRKTPVRVYGLTGVKAIAVGSYHSLAVKEDGTVWAWGFNGSGQLGDGTNNWRVRPVQVSGLIGVKAITAGYYHSLALNEDGTVWAWGDNYFGQLGDDTNSDSTICVQVCELAGVKAIASGAFHSLALREDGTVWAWGYNYYGQLGDDTNSDSTIPVQVCELTEIHSIGSCYNHSLALNEDGTVWAWGANGYGQLGDGTTTSRTIPVQVSGLTGVKAIAGGDSHSLAVKEDGTVWTWGDNYYGQLGDGKKTMRISPVEVSSLTGVKAIARGVFHSLALNEDGTVWAWGNNSAGQLGDGTTISRIIPVKVSGLTETKAIDGGYFHSLAVKEDGTVWAWGRNSDGQLGDGTTTNRTSPAQVNGITGVKAVAAGDYHSLALKEDGTVWAWGSNSYGQLGDGTTTSKTIPVQVSGLIGVKAITAGDSHSLALKEDGTVWAWGYNIYGQIGDGTTINRTTPVQISGLADLKAFAGGSRHSLALKEDRTVWAWGDNGDGQLGDGVYVLFATIPMGIYGTPPYVTATSMPNEISLTYGIIGGTIYYEVESMVT